MRLISTIVASSLVAAVCAAAAAAGLQTPAQIQYTNPLKNERPPAPLHQSAAGPPAASPHVAGASRNIAPPAHVGGATSNAAPPVPAVKAQTLPFTGLDLAGAVGAAVVLVAFGGWLWRRGREPQPH
jgi:hypothetical protein